MGVEGGPKPGVVHTEERDDDVFPYCGDTRHTEFIQTEDGTFIVSITNTDTPGDGESSEVVYPEDLPA